MGKRIAAFILTVLLAAMMMVGCTSGEEKVPPKNDYIKWTKVADGEYLPFDMPGYMDTKGLFLQRIGYDRTEDSFFADEGNGKIRLVPSGFDVNAEIDKAESLLREKERDTSGMSTRFLPKRNAVLILCNNSPELWLYQIESGELELLGDASYTGTPFETIYDSAFAKWGEEAYVYPYEGVIPSPNERYLAFGSSLSSVDGNTGQEVYLYDMDEKKERILLTGQSAVENYYVKGWVSDRWLLCTREIFKTKDGVNQGIESREAFVVNTEGERVILNLPDTESPESYRYLYGGGGVVLTASGEKAVYIMALKIKDDGSVEVLLDHSAKKGNLINDIKMNSRATWAAYLNAPDPASFERELHVIRTEDGTERIIAPLQIGDGIETGIKDFYWIDENRLLVILRENWADQETASTWVLDLRAGEAGTTTSAAIETDLARLQDQAKTRDASTMADAYMAVLEYIYGEEPEVNGAEYELKFMALDTKDMLWLTPEEKELLFFKMRSTWKVDVMDKTYVELKDSGYLDEAGYLSEGMLFKITGGFMNNNAMKVDVFKWRSGEDMVQREKLLVRFENDKWNVVK